MLSLFHLSGTVARLTHLLIPTTRKNLKSFTDVPEKSNDSVRQHRSPDKLVLDLGSPVNETHGRRERSKTPDKRPQ